MLAHRRHIDLLTSTNLHWHWHQHGTSHTHKLAYTGDPVLHSRLYDWPRLMAISTFLRSSGVCNQCNVKQMWRKQDAPDYSREEVQAMIDSHGVDVDIVEYKDHDSARPATVVACSPGLLELIRDCLEKLRNTERRNHAQFKE